ncbi:hypothetical protein LSAT2_023409 [Lamellibrachia satsuma]|nr:hypothetical protein LSAT2_023409 [Lamellibrachia satsuma]
MNSYLRGRELLDSELPSIRRGGLLDSSVNRSRGVSFLDEAPFSEDRLRYAHASAPYARPGSPTYYPRPPSPTQKHLVELQDQVRIFKEELGKKDRLITQLTSLENPRQRVSYDASKIEEFYSNDRLSATATAKSDVARLQVKVEGLQAQLREVQAQLDAREDKIRELKLQAETARESEAKHIALVHSLRQKLCEYDASHGSLEGAANRSEVAIQTLQRDNKESNERIVELESRLRTHLAEREAAEQERDTATKKLHDITSRLSTYLNTDAYGSNDLASSEVLIQHIKDVVQECAIFKGKEVTLKEHLLSAEAENKASRETIMRLVNESEREKKFSSRYTVEVENLRLERDNAEAKQRDLQRELDSLNERLEASQRAWTATKRELAQYEGRYTHLDREAHNQSIVAQNAETQYRNLKEQLARMLCDDVHKVEPYEEQIRDHVQRLQMALREKSAHVNMLENKLASVTEHLSRQADVQRSAERRAKKLEVDIMDYEERFKNIDSDLCTRDVLQDRLKSDKDRYLRILEELMRVMHMDPLAGDVGFDMMCDTIVARAAQLQKLETDSLVDRKTHIYNLQRKLKSMKEQLESKDLHLEMLRKKVCALEESLANRSSLEREKDDEFVRNRKLTKLVERYKRELSDMHAAVRELKARLLESSEIKNDSYEKEKIIEALESRVGQLEHVNEKQARKIAGLQGEVENTGQTLVEKRQTANNTIHALSSELRTTKGALGEISKRERQLLDFRQVIARMLGLDVNSLAVPDYEIIARLEKLILANKSNVATVVALDTALDDMEDGFRAGYQDASRVLAAVPRARSPVRRMGPPARSRSLSPRRKRDKRVY